VTGALWRARIASELADLPAGEG